MAKKSFRLINNKKFFLQGTASPKSKKEALDNKIGLQKRGFETRVVKIKGGYSVYAPDAAKFWRNPRMK